MRKPKYQAFITYECTMVQVTSLNLIENTEYEHEYLSTGIYLDGEGEYEPVGFVLSDAKLRQYTGLKDRNGKEIYEGDILGTDNQEPLHVEFSDKHAGFVFVDEFDKYGTTKYSAKDIFYESFEVIGNIYENPELLLRYWPRIYRKLKHTTRKECT